MTLQEMIQGSLDSPCWRMWGLWHFTETDRGIWHSMHYLVIFSHIWKELESKSGPMSNWFKKNKPDAKNPVRCSCWSYLPQRHGIFCKCIEHLTLCTYIHICRKQKLWGDCNMYCSNHIVHTLYFICLQIKLLPLPSIFKGTVRRKLRRVKNDINW